MSPYALMTALAPEFVLLVGACVTMLAGVRRSSPDRAIEPLLALLFTLVALGVTVFTAAPEGREAAFGLWLTSLTHYARLAGLGVGVVIILANWRQPVAEERGEFMSLILFSLLGILITASANDLLVLFFALELVSVPTYVLIALSRLDQRASEAALKYFFLGALAAALMAFGFVFLYGASGTTLLHDVVNGEPRRLLPVAFDGPMMIGLLLALGGLSFKIAAVPFHAYAPDVYEGAAAPVSGLLGFVPKFAGFLALIKLLGAIDWTLPEPLFWTIWIIAAATMTAGNALALLQRSAKRLLAYSSIAHTGYMLVALIVGPMMGQGPLGNGVAAVLFYMAVYGLMNLGAFIVLAAQQSEGRESDAVDDLAGLAGRSPAMALVLAVCVFSLMGFPPTAGFLGKWYALGSALTLPATHPHHGALMTLVLVAAVNAAVAAAYYLRLVAAAYSDSPGSRFVPSGGWSTRLSLALCVVGLLGVFIYPGPLVSQARRGSLVTRVIASTSAPPTSAYVAAQQQSARPAGPSDP